MEILYKIKAIADINDVRNGVDGIRKIFNDLQVNPKLKTVFKDIFTDLTSQIDKVEKQINNGIFDQKSLNSFKTNLNSVIGLFNQLYANSRNIKLEDFAGAFKADPKDIEGYINEIKRLEDVQKNLATDALKSGTALSTAYNKAREAIGQTYNEQEKVWKGSKKVSEAWDQFINNIKTGQLDEAYKNLQNINKSLKLNSNVLKEAPTYYDPLKKAFDALVEESAKVQISINEQQHHIQAAAEPVEGYEKALELLLTTIKKFPELLNGFGSSIENSSKGAINASKNIDALINRFEYFFSLTNAFRLLKRTITSAFNTVKELDAAMTETATVTEYSVNQMWGKLDEYTAIANKLGATTLGTYKTITLFFQQGLDEQQSLALATETMKMARVAGIDYAEATQYMTSALRGFNMELNETSATRVNDVYSELAKITAADTNQIAIAMSKVASLANSANMELETTSAILSQIIETTQEAPETAGTALKTIIARFAEVKKLYSQGELTGQDEEGEEIDVNKVSVALRKAGINLNDFITGNKGLDEIFLELSKKWNSLDLVTQRYIATMAAGSRQQSRFIAMMQDYDRLIELTNAAYNSAGSGQEQFEKTLDSLEAKLNKLTNAWDSFTMSIADSDVLKTAVDGLTAVLTVVNGITDAFGKASGAVKLLFAAGLSKIATIFAGNAFLAMRNYQGDDMLGKLAAGRATFGNSGQQVGSFLTNWIDPTKELREARRALNSEMVGLRHTHKDNESWINDPDAAKRYTQIKTELKAVDQQLDSSALSAQVFNRNLSAIGAVASLAGAGLKQLSKQLEETDKSSSVIFASLGDVVQTLGNMAMILGTIGRLLPQFGEFLTGIGGGPLLIIGITIAAIKDFINSMADAYAAEQAFQSGTARITSQISDMGNKFEALEDAQTELDSLTKGTLEWSNKLNDVTTQYEKLIELYPELKDFITLTKDGVKIDYKGYQAYKEDLNNEGITRAGLNEVRSSVSSSRYYTAVDPTTGLEKTAFERGSYDKDILSRFFPYVTETEADNAYKTASSQTFGYWQQFGTDKDAAIAQLEELTGTKLTDEERQQDIDEIYALIESAIFQQLLGGIEEKAEEEAGSYLRDKKGQNLEATYGEDRTELEEQQDAALVTNEDADALYKYWDTLKNKLPKALAEDKVLLKGLALESADALKYFKDFSKVLSDNQKVLESLDKTSSDYQVALGKVIAASEKAFGTMLDRDFVEENLTDFIDAFVEGSDAALDRIRANLIDNSPLNDIPVTLDDGSVTNAMDIINELITDKDFLVTGSADLTELFNSLVAAGVDIEKLQDQIQKLGFEILVSQTQNPDGSFSVNAAVLHDTARNAVRNARAGSTKKSGGSSKKEKAWENPYDQLYNLTERNEEAIRKRNILEKEYNALLRDRESEANSLVKLSLQELANLQEQLAYQKQLQAGRLKQLNSVNRETWTDSEGNRKSYEAWDVTQYANYNQKTNTIEIDWDAIDKVTDETKGKAIEDYIKRLEELQKELEGIDTNILDIEAEIDEVNRRSMDNYLDLEQRVYDALVQQRQEIIDAYSSLNDTLNDTNDRILNDLREQIDLERQIRDNTKTEQDIADKEARLAYLQRDTSGANTTETLRLQKEIDDARQAYSDSLIDQQINAIEKGNQEAAEQRQTQITIMQNQLKYWSENGAFWEQTAALLSSAIDENGVLDLNNSALVELLEHTDGYKGMSEFGKQAWKDDLAETFLSAQEGFAEWMMDKARQAGEITQDGNTYTYDKDKKAWMLDGEAYTAMYDPVTKQYIFTRTKDLDVKVGEIGGEKDEIKADNSEGTPGKRGKGEDVEPEIPSAASRLKDYVVTYEDWSTVVTAASEQAAKIRAVIRYKKDKNLGDNFPQQTWMKYATVSLAPLRYAEGGMVSFTGPAWLDGTKTKPEAVLNAKQTELFISLRDMLEKFGQTGGFTNSYGNTYVDLDVNADIGSDYDVDSLVNRLKRDILDSSSYRNVNMLSRGH